MFNEKETGTKSMVPQGKRSGIVIALRAVHDNAEYPLETEVRRWVLGSSESSDIQIDDPYVSSVHCILERRPGGAIMVRDRPSRNGTMIDGNMVEAAELRVGSYLSIGRTTLVAVAAPASGDDASALAQLRGRDSALRNEIDAALKAANSDCAVLIVGETGTGKDLLARVVHEASRRAVGKFVPVNCGGIPKELIGSELFGHEKGAFTGALTERDGYFVEANGGTLFLDEIGELPIALQPHLLRALESKRVRRIGGSAERVVDVRIIAATNRLDKLGPELSGMRSDLYHRIATVVIKLPPLRERMDDVPELVHSFLDEMMGEEGDRRINEDAWTALLSHHWPGNVRELRHAVARAVTMGNQELGAADFFPDLKYPARTLPSLPAEGAVPLVPYQQVLRGAMEQALASKRTIRAAAEHLGMAKSTFADRARAWGLLPPKTRGKRAESVDDDGLAELDGPDEVLAPDPLAEPVESPEPDALPDLDPLPEA